MMTTLLDLLWDISLAAVGFGLGYVVMHLVLARQRSRNRATGRFNDYWHMVDNWDK